MPDGVAAISPLYCYEKQRLISSHVLDRKQLLSGAQLDEITKRLPAKVFRPNKLAAVAQAVVMLATFFAGVAVQAWLPWQASPLSWVLLAVALNTAFFIGHDCVHGTWTSSPLINTIVGEICFTPLLHPYQAFKHLHLTHVVTDKVVGQASDGTALHIDSQKAHTVSLLAEIGLVRFFGQLYLPWKFPVEVRARVTASILFSLVLVSAATVVCVQLVGPHAPLTCWLIPLVLYKDLFFINLLTFLRNRIHVLLPHQLATRIASYHLFSASFIIREVINDDAFGGEGNGKSTGKTAAPYVPPPHRSRISAADWEKRPLLQRLNWVHLVILTVLPVTSVWGCLSTPLQRNTAWWAFCYYLFTGAAAAAAVELVVPFASTLEYCRRIAIHSNVLQVWALQPAIIACGHIVLTAHPSLCASSSVLLARVRCKAPSSGGVAATEYITATPTPISIRTTQRRASGGPTWDGCSCCPIQRTSFVATSPTLRPA